MAQICKPFIACCGVATSQKKSKEKRVLLSVRFALCHITTVKYIAFHPAALRLF